MPQHDDLQDDATLVQRVLAGEREAFGPLLLRYSHSVVRLCHRMLGSSFEAQDVAQEAALEAFLGLRDLKEPARFGSWLHGIAANRTRMALRRRHMLPLNTLGDDATMTVLGTRAIPTPEDAYDVREVHDAIVAAINDLSVVNREAVIGVFLDGYSYAELAELLGVSVSTVRGRLFQGRQQLRRALGPRAGDGAMVKRSIAAATTKEIPMEQADLVEMTIIGIQKVPFPTPRPTYGITLRELGTAIELRLVLREAEAGVNQSLQGEPLPGALLALPPDLLLRLLAPFAVTVERIVIYRLIDVSLYTTVTLTQAAERVEVDVRLEEGLALASVSRAPLYVGRSILDMMGVDVAEPALEEDAQRQLQQRLAVRVVAAEAPIPAPIPLTATVQQQVDNVLTQLRTDVGAVDVVLMHRSGELVAAQGPADRATLVQYCKALQVAAENAHDATELRRYRSLLTDALFTPDAWLLYWPWSDWTLQISGLPDEETPLDAEMALTRLKQTAHDLARWLQGSANT